MFFGGTRALGEVGLAMVGASAAKGAQGLRLVTNTERTLIAAERGAVDLALDIPKSSQVTRIQAMLSRYPEVIDLRTGRPMSFPADIGAKIPKADRISWGANQRGEFITEWYERGYTPPKGGWSNYDIHHIKPREYGGSNDFWNLSPVARQTHKELNSFWKGFTGL
jgi:hypothetical protein